MTQLSIAVDRAKPQVLHPDGHALWIGRFFEHSVFRTESKSTAFSRNMLYPNEFKFDSGIGTISAKDEKKVSSYERHEFINANQQFRP
jgi:hypothetical protein